MIPSNNISNIEDNLKKYTLALTLVNKDSHLYLTENFKLTRNLEEWAADEKIVFLVYNLAKETLRDPTGPKNLMQIRNLQLQFADFLRKSGDIRCAEPTPEAIKAKLVASCTHDVLLTAAIRKAEILTKVDQFINEAEALKPKTDFPLSLALGKKLKKNDLDELLLFRKALFFERKQVLGILKFNLISKLHALISKKIPTLGAVIYHPNNSVSIFNPAATEVYTAEQLTLLLRVFQLCRRLQKCQPCGASYEGIMQDLELLKKEQKAGDTFAALLMDTIKLQQYATANLFRDKKILNMVWQGGKQILNELAQYKTYWSIKLEGSFEHISSLLSVYYEALQNNVGATSSVTSSQDECTRVQAHTITNVLYKTPLYFEPLFASLWLKEQENRETDQILYEHAMKCLEGQKNVHPKDKIFFAREIGTVSVIFPPDSEGHKLEPLQYKRVSSDDFKKLDEKITKLLQTSGEELVIKTLVKQNLIHKIPDASEREAISSIEKLSISSKTETKKSPLPTKAKVKKKRKCTQVKTVQPKKEEKLNLQAPSTELSSSSSKPLDSIPSQQKEMILYHPRVTRWFSDDPSVDPFVTDPHYSAKVFSEHAKKWIIAEHSFAKVADRYILNEGLQVDKSLMVVGEMTIGQETRKGLFVLAFDKNSKQATKTCYHRGFTTKTNAELIEEFAAKGFYKLDYPSFQEVFEDQKCSINPSKALLEDGSYVEKETKHVVTIQDPKNNARIRLCRLERAD